MLNAALHAQLGKLRRQQQFPSANNGQSFLGPNGALTGAADSQVYFCVRIHPIDGDPNSSDPPGLDSNGYYQANIESNYFQSMATAAPVVRVKPPDNGGFMPNARIWCYAVAITQGSPTPGDDGYMLMVPIVGEAGGGYMFANLAALYPSTTAFSASGKVTFSTLGGAFGFTTTDSTNFKVPDDSAYLAIATASFKPGWSGDGTTQDVILAVTGPSFVGANVATVGFIGSTPGQSMGYASVTAVCPWTGGGGGNLYVSLTLENSKAIALNNIDLTVMPVGAPSP